MSPSPVKIIKDYMGRPTSIQIAWDIQDANEIGYVLQSAGRGPKGEIRDHGFYDDGTALLEAVWEAEKILRGEEAT